MSPDFLHPSRMTLERAKHQGLSYQKFIKTLQQELQLSPSRKEKSAPSLADILRLHWARMDRIMRTYQPPESLRRCLQIQSAQTWVVITDPRCSDSAQLLPALAKIADSQPHIQLLILLRDEHPDIMDLYLTDGKRSIPKLIAIDSEGQQQFIWGPRPSRIQQQFLKLQQCGVSKSELARLLQRWYREDQFRSLHQDLRQLLRCPDTE